MPLLQPCQIFRIDQSRTQQDHVIGIVRRIAGVQRDAVLPYALQAQRRHVFRRLRRQTREALIVPGLAPVSVPPGAKQQELRLPQGLLLPPQHGQRDFRRSPAIQHEAPPGEGLRREVVQCPPAWQHMGRSVHMGAGVGVHLQQRLPEAVLLHGTGRRQPGRLRTGIHRHLRCDAVGQIQHFHVASPLSVRVCSQIIRAAMSAGDTPEMRLACPRSRGRTAASFSRASSRSP